MLSQAERNQIIDLINREVVPAIGCTEPIAVALCTARAAETLGGEPEKIINILRSKEDAEECANDTYLGGVELDPAAASESSVNLLGENHAKPRPEPL